jgi:ribose-phosphate pyrophosphokinase
LTGRAHPALALEISKKLGIKPTKLKLSNFANSEINCQIDESVRGGDVFIIQSHGGNVNDALMEQAILIDAAKRASAASITAVCPFLGYARQDRKSSGREPISARLVVDILATAGADRIMSIDLHSGQTQGFFDGPFDHLIAMPTLIKYISRNFKSKDLVMVAPDAGRVKVAERYSSTLGCSMAIIHKHRSKVKSNTAEAKYLIGDVSGKTCIIIDDMIDTAGTLCAAAELLSKHGAKTVYGMATHGLLSGPALERIEASTLTKVIVTNTLPGEAKKSKKIEVLSIAPLLASAIKTVFNRESVSKLFDGKNQI